MVKNIHGFFKSFHHAGKGVVFVLRGRNFRVQLAGAILATLMGVYFFLNWVEWLVIILVISAVLAVEALNTAIEEVCDVVKDLPGTSPDATRVARDIAASSSLIISLGALMVGLIIFLPKILALFN